MTGPENYPPSCVDLVGALAEPDRRSAFAALVLGATSLGEIAELAKLQSSVAVAALQKLSESRLVVVNREAHTYALVEDAFRRAMASRAVMAPVPTSAVAA